MSHESLELSVSPTDVTWYGLLEEYTVVQYWVNKVPASCDMQDLGFTNVECDFIDIGPVCKLI